MDFLDNELNAENCIKSNEVYNFTECPICGEVHHLFPRTDLVLFACGTLIEIDLKKHCGVMKKKCKYNLLKVYRENDYDPTMHYDTTYLETAGIVITGCCMYSNRFPLDLLDTAMLIYKDNKGLLTLENTGTVAGSVKVIRQSDNIKSAVDKYIKDYNNIHTGNIWSFDVVDNKGQCVDRMLGLIGLTLKELKELSRPYGVFEEDIENAWKERDYGTI